MGLVLTGSGAGKSVHVRDMVFKYLRDGSSIDMNVDGSSTAVAFEFVPTRLFKWHRSAIEILDEGAPTRSEFGSGPALSNGLLIQVLDASDVVQQDFLDGEPAKTNGDIAFLTGGVDVSFFDGTGNDDAVAWRWSVDRAAGGKAATVPAGWKIRVTVQDDLTGLVRFHWQIQGFYS